MLLYECQIQSSECGSDKNWHTAGRRVGATEAGYILEVATRILMYAVTQCRTPKWPA